MTECESSAITSPAQFRILYFFQMHDQIVLVHGFSKKTRELKKQDIDLAEKRMKDWMRRFPAGGKIMKKSKVRTFQSRLQEDIKDPEFKKYYQEERQALKLAMSIAELRNQKGLSQQELAKLMGTSQQAISRVESGEYEGFTLKTLEKIAEATGMRVKIEFVAT